MERPNRIRVLSRSRDANAIQSRSLPRNAVVFIGDSIVAGLDATKVSSRPGVNFGIGNDTMAGVLWRLSQYENLNRARAIVLSVGINDVGWRSDEEIVKNYAKILEVLPRGVPIVAAAILPVNEKLIAQAHLSLISGYRVSNDRIRKINAGIRVEGAKNRNVQFVDARERLVDAEGNLCVKYTVGDGVHLSRDGYSIWQEALGQALKQR